MTDGEWEIRGPDGTEYEQATDVRDIACSCTVSNTRGDFELIAIRPKRKQTGWSCTECGARCLLRCVFMSKPDTPCLFADLKPDWQPFYGKVVE